MDALNEEFERLLRRSGWGNAEAARQLELSAGMITQYRDGSIKPSRTVLKLFQKLVEGDSEAHQQVLTEWEEELLEGLRAVDPKMRRRAGAAFRELALIMSEAAPQPENPRARMPPYPQVQESQDVTLNEGGASSAVDVALAASGAAGLRTAKREEAALRSGRSRSVNRVYYDPFISRVRLNRTRGNIGVFEEFVKNVRQMKGKR